MTVTLNERGLTPELIERFGIGYCEKGIMAGRVCIPIHNADGELVAYAGRWPGEPPEWEEKYKLPKGFQKGLELFNLHRAKHCKHLFIVEGYFGAIRLYALRMPAVALMGSSMSEAQVELLKEHCPNLTGLTIMLDGDEAGRDGARDVANRLWDRGWWVRKSTLSQGSEPDTVPAETIYEAARLKKV